MMKGNSYFSCISVLVLIYFLLSVNRIKAGESHDWQAISYPMLKCEFGGGDAWPSIKIASSQQMNGLQLGLSGIQFRLGFLWSKSEADKAGFSWPDGSEMKLRLHYPDGGIVEASESTFTEKLNAVPYEEPTSSGFEGSFYCVFPWGENEMQEAWLEIVFPERSYWLVIPYGFMRDPKAPELPVSEAGSAKLPKALVKAPAKVKLVNWERIHYDFGEIKNGWKLSLRHSNPFDAHTELILYRKDSEVGKSMFLWGLHYPLTQVSIKQDDGFVLRSRGMSLRLHDDGFRRSDKFEFYQNPSVDHRRDWGIMTIKIDEKEHTQIMPSSLFKNAHGIHTSLR
ncbi:MAG: hypothetical protein L3J39_07460 [Verrucomicrobiales bacterium]|nr:hypothetical protein [Verrucomicrobiales bacterium]